MSMFRVTALIAGKGRIQHMLRADGREAAIARFQAAYSGEDITDMETARVKR